ncbi:MAG: zinc-binding dehydrogenase [Gammaproteobacteria bacterium]|nr:zinc-binding dehydrogenase [Gammaproteobacteria bacterium]
MRAIVIQQYGGPEQLMIQELPIPEPKAGEVVIRVHAFGLNRAETYMRKGAWGDVAQVSGIECVGTVVSDSSGHLPTGQKVAALMGGMGRRFNGSYAEFTRVPAANVAPLTSTLAWEELAALPESYATAWSCLHQNLAIEPNQTLMIRGATSALGQAALNIARHHGVRVIAGTRSPDKLPTLKALGAECVLLESADLARDVRQHYSQGVDAVLDIIGNSTVLNSLAAVRRHGRVCLAGFLGGGTPISSFDPLSQMPSGVHLSFFASFMFGTPEFPLSQVPLQSIVERAESGVYRAKPARVFRFDEIQEAHRLMETDRANGKLVVRLAS